MMITRTVISIVRRCSKFTDDFKIKSISLKQKIIANTVVTNQHLTPEISLRLITNKCRLFHATLSEDIEKDFENDPFWAFYWPGGQALSRFILDNPSVVGGKHVLDVGSGSGACSIAAIMSGANSAIANDIDSVASIAVQLNAELNKVSISTCSKNRIGDPCKNIDVVLVGDVFYDKEIADEIIPWLIRLRKCGKKILVGDPGRHALSSDALLLMQKVATYELPENSCIENNGFKFVNVWKMK